MTGVILDFSYRRVMTLQRMCNITRHNIASHLFTIIALCIWIVNLKMIEKGK